MPKNPDVDAWMAVYDNPMKDVVQAIREVFLDDDRFNECIKWKTPTFTFEGNLASFNPRSKKHASVLFHEGALIPGAFSRLEGTGDTARTMKLASLDDVEAARDEIRAIQDAWCAWRIEKNAAKRK